MGDTARDLVAGVAVGCEPHLVLTGKGAAYAGKPLPETFPPARRCMTIWPRSPTILLAASEAVTAATR